MALQGTVPPKAKRHIPESSVPLGYQVKTFTTTNVPKEQCTFEVPGTLEENEPPQRVGWLSLGTALGLLQNPKPMPSHEQNLLAPFPWKKTDFHVLVNMRTINANCGALTLCPATAQ